MATFIEPLLPSRLKSCFEILIRGLGGNPRQVKRFINGLVLNDELARTLSIVEYKPATLATLLLVQYRKPDLWQFAGEDAELLPRLVHDDDEELFSSLLGDDPRLAAAIEASRDLGFPAEAQALKPYVHLALVAGVEPEEGPKRAHEEQTLNASGVSSGTAVQGGRRTSTS
jgi:hypothetical protein